MLSYSAFVLVILCQGPIISVMRGINLHIAAVILFTGIFMISSCLGPRTRVHIDEDDIPDETLLIIVQTEMDNEAAYESVKESLLKRGYTFMPDTEIMNGVSDIFYGIAERWDPNLIHIRLGITITGESNVEIGIRGWFTALEYEGRPEEVEQQIIIMREGFGGSIGREAWIEMFQIASGIEGIMRFEQI
jgi:hypothetical protein